MFEIKLAEREAAPITCAIIGESGAGKTYSALKFARGLVGPEGKIIVIDSEGGRSKIYANDPAVAPFFHIDLQEPYTSERFREAYKFAEKNAHAEPGKTAIIVDTISHEHEGFLEYADKEEQRLAGKAGVARNKWIKPKAQRKLFYSKISSSGCHTIVTIRLNRIVDMDVKPAKEIMKPECDKDLPYKMDLSVVVGKEDHRTNYIKVPEPLKPFVQDGVLLSAEHGKLLAGNIADQKKPDEKFLQIIKNLEEAADSGADVLKTAWEAAWRNMPPEQRPVLKGHLDRLKGLAKAAEEKDAIDYDNPFPKEEEQQSEDEEGLFRNDDR